MSSFLDSSSNLLRRRKRRKKANTRKLSGNFFIFEGTEREASRERVYGKYKVMKKIKAAAVIYNVDDEFIFNKNDMLF